jgi:hypothetical protein
MRPEHCFSNSISLEEFVPVTRHGNPNQNNDIFESKMKNIYHGRHV